MALDKHSRSQNVKASLEKYIADNLVTGEGLRVSFEGLSFESATETEWIEETILSFGNRDYHRQVDSTRKGQTTQVMLNFNIFVVPEKTKRTNRHYELRDKVATYFHLDKQIDLYDFEEGEFTTSLQKLEVREIITDSPIPDENFQQYTYTVGIDWLEKWPE